MVYRGCPDHNFARAGSIVGDFPKRNLARGRIPLISVRRIALDLASIVEDVTQRFGIQAQEKNIGIETHIKKLPEKQCDPLKLSWLVSNLIGDALRYTPRKWNYRRRRTPIGRECRQFGGNRLGPGIAPEIPDPVFERFAQFGINGYAPWLGGSRTRIVKNIRLGLVRFFDSRLKMARRRARCWQSAQAPSNRTLSSHQPSPCVSGALIEVNGIAKPDSDFGAFVGLHDSPIRRSRPRFNRERNLSASLDNSEIVSRDASFAELRNQAPH